MISDVFRSSSDRCSRVILPEGKVGVPQVYLEIDVQLLNHL